MVCIQIDCFFESQRFASVLNSLQYDLILLTGDYPIVDFSLLGRYINFVQVNVQQRSLDALLLLYVSTYPVFSSFCFLLSKGCGTVLALENAALHDSVFALVSNALQQRRSALLLPVRLAYVAEANAVFLCLLLSSFFLSRTISPNVGPSNFSVSILPTVVLSWLFPANDGRFFVVSVCVAFVGVLHVLILLSSSRPALPSCIPVIIIACCLRRYGWYPSGFRRTEFAAFDECLRSFSLCHVDSLRGNNIPLREVGTCLPRMTQVERH